ncbi:hypothetical protein GQ473_06270 [archaeon]|nr:hypothetical protein [archaeon]
MVLISEKTNYIVTSTIALLVSIIVFSLSGITKNHILMPMNISLDIFTEVNFVYLFISLVFFALSISLQSVYVLKSKSIDFKLLIVPFVGALAIFVFAKLSLMMIFLGLSLIIGTIIISYSIKNEKEEYKKLSAYKISTHGASKMLLLVAILLAVTVYIQLDSDTSYARNTTDNLLQTTTGLSRENLTDIDMAIKEQQRDASYAYIDALKDTYVSTLETTGDLTEAERKTCIDAFQNDLDEFDSKSKEAIDAQLEKPSDFNTTEKLSTVVTMLDLLETMYPLLIAITLFAFLSTLNSMIIVPLVGLFSWLFWKNTQKPAKKEDIENYLNSNAETKQAKDSYYEN